MCGGEIQREHGILSSPNYPEYYKPSKECVWKITVPDGFTAALKFQSFEVCSTFNQLIEQEHFTPVVTRSEHNAQTSTENGAAF